MEPVPQRLDSMSDLSNQNDIGTKGDEKEVIVMMEDDNQRRPRSPQSRLAKTVQKYLEVIKSDLELMGVDVTKVLPPTVHHVLTTKSCHCNHDSSCFLHVIRKAIRGWSLGYLFNAFLAAISFLFNLKKVKNPARMALKVVLSTDNFMFGLFPGVFSMISHGVLCLLRHINKHDTGRNSFIAGALAGFFSMFFVQNKSRSQWALFLLARAVDAWYQHLVNTGKIKDSSFYSVAALTICNMFLVPVSWSGTPYAAPKGILGFYNQAATFRPNEKTLMHVWRTLFHRSFKLDAGPVIGFTK